MKREGKGANETDLPDWAKIIEPLKFEEAARVLGISRRFLTEIVKLYPHYELRGRKKVFYPEHIERLRECLNQRNTKTANTTPTAPLMLNALERLSILETKEMLRRKHQN